jgi:hypothetical protein
MEPEGSLLHLQEPATCSYPEPAQSSPCPPSHFMKIHFKITGATIHLKTKMKEFNMMVMVMVMVMMMMMMMI